MKKSYFSLDTATIHFVPERNPDLPITRQPLGNTKSPGLNPG
jgi:hypothetical protein